MSVAKPRTVFVSKRQGSLTFIQGSRMTKTDLLICNVLVKEGNFCNGSSVVSNILAYSARHTYVTNYTKVEKKPAKTNSFRYMLLITCDYVASCSPVNQDVMC